jgi:hypothetical protein
MWPSQTEQKGCWPTLARSLRKKSDNMKTIPKVVFVQKICCYTFVLHCYNHLHISVNFNMFSLYLGGGHSRGALDSVALKGQSTQAQSTSDI